MIKTMYIEWIEKPKEQKRKYRKYPNTEEKFSIFYLVNDIGGFQQMLSNYLMTKANRNINSKWIEIQM